MNLRKLRLRQAQSDNFYLTLTTSNVTLNHNIIVTLSLSKGEFNKKLDLKTSLRQAQTGMPHSDSVMSPSITILLSP